VRALSPLASGRIQKIVDPEIDRYVTINEGDDSHVSNWSVYPPSLTVPNRLRMVIDVSVFPL